MRIFVLLCAAFLASAATAETSRWEHFMVTEDTFYRIDKKSIKRNGPKVIAWLSLEHRTKQTLDSAPQKTYWSSMWRVSVNCRDETFLSLHMTHYEGLDRQGAQVFTMTNQDRPDWYNPVMPDSVGEVIKDRLCTSK